MHASKHLIILLLYSSLLPLIFSCNKEDDTDSIFNGYTWYISGVTINNKSINGEDIKTIYKSPTTYYIHFNSDQTFTGKLSGSSSLSGSWEVQSKKREFSLTIINKENVNSITLDQNIFTILQNIRFYAGDTNNMCLKADNRNLINFTRNKTTNTL